MRHCFQWCLLVILDNPKSPSNLQNEFLQFCNGILANTSFRRQYSKQPLYTQSGYQWHSIAVLFGRSFSVARTRSQSGPLDGDPSSSLHGFVCLVSSHAVLTPIPIRQVSHFVQSPLTLRGFIWNLQHFQLQCTSVLSLLLGILNGSRAIKRHELVYPVHIRPAPTGHSRSQGSVGNFRNFHRTL